jgi:hypothetical protein
MTDTGLPALDIMPLKLKKSRFSRNKDREKEFGDIFNKTSKGLSYILTLVITVFFTPAMITTTLFSKEMIIMLANISLSLGYLTSFAWHIYHGEISKAVLVLSALAVVAFLVAAWFLFPPLSALTFVNLFGFVNQLAVGVNLYFLVKDVIIPPCIKLIENICQRLGFEIEGRYYSKPPLTLEEDRYVIDHLLRKSYGHDSSSPKFQQVQLDHFNNLLTKLSKYIDKYDESLFGYINNKDAITDLEKQIAQLTTQANAESSYTFIRKKIGFRTTKINMLEEAKDTLSKILETPGSDASCALSFFKGLNEFTLNKHRQKALTMGLKCLDKELHRQREKIAELKDCLPVPEPDISP